MAEAFDAALTDVVQVQADIASRVVEALDVALGKGQRQSLAERPTTSLDAYDAFLRGEARSDHLSTGDAVKLRAAIQEYRRAVALDSTFAQAWAQLSRAYSYYYQVVTPTAEATAGAKQAADRAAALAPGTTATYLAESDYLFEVVADYRKALNVMEEGLRTAPSNADLLAGAGFAETRLGRWQSGLARLERAMALDPHTPWIAQLLATVHLKLGHFPEALEVVRRGLSVAPDNLDLIDEAITIHLAQGDRRASDSMIQARPASVDEAALAVYLAVYGDLYWLLDARQQRLALEAPVDQYPDRAAWGLALAEIHRSSGRLAASRVYADSACLALEEQLKAAPGDPLRHSLMGLSLAYLGRKTEAIREGEKGLAMVLNRIGGPYARLQLGRIYLLTGEPAKALDELEVLIPMRSSYTPAWLRLDPTFDPIRTEPRFQKLVASR